MGNTRSTSYCFKSANCFEAPEFPEDFIAYVLTIRRFNYKELCKATGNFGRENKIGARSFGNIYKGVLGDGTLATLKVLSDPRGSSINKFINEIHATANIEHENLVKLLGFCLEGEHTILVYKYLKNRNLAQTLFSEEPHVIDWSWPMRRRICTGVAKGLCFLHEAQIVHRDINPNNILLDDDFVPKISNFGIAKRFDSDVSQITAEVAGTFGYIAPEYMCTGRITKQVDVYSFGVMLLEIVSGRRQIVNIDEVLLDIAWALHEKGELRTLIDGSITSLDVEEACSYLKIGLLCTRDNFRLRPSISTVLKMLRGKCRVNTDNISRSGDTVVSEEVSPRKTKYDIIMMTPSDSEISSPLNDPGKVVFLSPENAEDDRSVQSDSTSLSTSFTYKEVKIITTNFSQKISSTDGDASMYFGFITKELRQLLGPLQVTVKICDGVKCYKGNQNEFQAQVDLAKKISHSNLVKILGHCFKGKHLILIHEIMARGSLADHLYAGEWSSLSWFVRVKIALDAARGLAYLHENSIFHGDFKPSNILMDTAYNAKVFTFGPEVNGPKELSSEVSATSLGTFGYAALEYSDGGWASMESDVYRFGVVLVELVSGRRWTANELVGFGGEKNVLRNVDARLKGKYPIKAAKDVATLACQCLDNNPRLRPCMGDIVDSLEILLGDHLSNSTTNENELIASEAGGSSPSLPSVSSTELQQNQLEITRNKEIPLLDLEIQSQHQGITLMLEGLGLTEAPKPEEWVNAREIYLMNNLLTNLPPSPRCPLLTMLLLQGNHKLRNIPTTFFEYMPLLQVLNLSKTHIKSLPDSLFELHNLKCLSLRDCGLFTVLSSKIGQLYQLELLDLKGTEITHLPKEIQNLTNLKCLKVSFYGDFSPESKQRKPQVLIPQGTISALSQLGELSIDVNPEDERWEEEAEAIFMDVCGLNGLHTLNLYFPTVTYLSYFKRPLALCFRFTVGPHSNRIMSRLPQDLETELQKWVKCLRIINGDDDDGHVDVRRILSQSTCFFLDRHKTSTMLSSFGVQNMQQLRHCIVGECNAMEYLIDGMSDFKSLESLHIYYMKNLRGMCSPGSSVDVPCLGNLRSLTLQTCPNLIVVFTPELLNNLINLEELRVEDCEIVRSLVMCQGYCFLPKLKGLSLHYLPELSSIANGLLFAPELEWLSFCDCPSLRSLKEVGTGGRVRRIEGERSWWEGLDWSNGRPVWLEDIFCSIDSIE